MRGQLAHRCARRLREGRCRDRRSLLVEGVDDVSLLLCGVTQTDSVSSPRRQVRHQLVGLKSPTITGIIQFERHFTCWKPETRGDCHFWILHIPLRHSALNRVIEFIKYPSTDTIDNKGCDKVQSNIRRCPNLSALTSPASAAPSLRPSLSPTSHRRHPNATMSPRLKLLPLRRFCSTHSPSRETKKKGCWWSHR